MFLFDQSFAAKKFQFINKHLLTYAGNRSFELSVTDYPSIDLENDEQSPLSSENLH
ncbi:hypothetical protein PORCAN_1681 [Porphyromonas crevioricanis JCM 13913]|nr:hypothetical protein PORCAN_1681 [Porphyromonas crevioricanis JCM 13913]